MKRSIINLLCCIVGLVMFAGVVCGNATNVWADRPYDFSDTREPFLKWPYKVISAETSGSYENFSVVHIYRLDISYAKLTKALMKAVDSKKPISGQFLVLGMTEMVDKSGFDGMIGYNHEHHNIKVFPDGAGSRVEVSARPDSIPSAVFDMAAYGFIMPDGGYLPIGLFRHDGL